MAALDNSAPASAADAGKVGGAPATARPEDTKSTSNVNGGVGLGGAKSMPGTRRHSGDASKAATANGASSSDVNTSGSIPAIAGPAAASGLPPVTTQPRGEDSLSATLERLRLNAQAAKIGAQNGGQGAGGIIGGRRNGPPPNSRLSKASLPNQSGNPALSGLSATQPISREAAAAVQAAALARNGSSAGSNAGVDGTQMGNFVFDDELDAELHNSTYGGRYLQMNADDDKFPVLIRRDSYPGILSAGSAALDLASLSQTPPKGAFMRGEGGPGARQTSEWPQFPNNAAGTQAVATSATTTGENAAGAAAAGGNARTGATEAAKGGAAASAQGTNGTPAGSASPRSGRGLPAARSATTPSGTAASANGPSSASAAGASGAASGGSSPNPATTGVTGAGSADGSASPVKASAGVNGAAAAAVASLVPPPSPEEQKRKAQLQRERERIERASAKFSDGTPSPAAMYAGELAALNGTFSPYPSGGPGGNGNGGAGNGGYYGADGNYGAYKGRNGAAAGAPGAQGQRREEPNRFAGLRLEDLQGDMASLCKDQHGCRFLQKKLEEGNAEHRDMIFNEIYPTFGELMTDSFGNYLSQKLLEHSTDEQRDALLESISGELVSISLNMHGTRAVQKMIDYLSTQRQVQSLIMALNLNVVTLIKDLNGNHVVQKCLNTLPPEDNQFIYNAVAANCIEVATHRHGCCVLQRCIDHASESQRIQLVTEITYNSLTLVLDPFGNYVVQYVLDLNDSRFISAIVNQFRNNVCALSAQKFSSNVVEKCIRVADLEGRKALISELIDRSRLERMLRDSFANYVVQTALDYAEPGQRAELVAIIRPVLPMIRNTPYGKRIQSKIQREGFHDGYGRGAYGHPGMYGGMGMGPGMGYYGMPHHHYGPPQHHGGPHGHPGAPHHPHHGGPPQHHGGPYGGGPGGPPEAYMGRGTPGPGGPYGHQGYPPQHMPPHMGSPAMSHPFSPSFGPSPTPGPPGGIEYNQQAPNYAYLG